MPGVSVGVGLGVARATTGDGVGELLAMGALGAVDAGVGDGASV